MELLRVTYYPAEVVATLNAESLDESNAEEVGQELSELAGRLGGRGLRLDFSAVQILTSSGLAQLLWLQKQVRTEGGRLSLWNVRPEVYEVFAVTRLTDLLAVSQAPQDGQPQSGDA